MSGKTWDCTWETREESGVGEAKRHRGEGETEVVLGLGDGLRRVGCCWGSKSR